MLVAWLIGPSRRQRSLAAAFIGEIAGILRSMDRRPGSEPPQGSTLPQAATCRFDTRALPKFTIYEANAEKIADFDKRTARELAYFYTCLSTLSERLRILSSEIELEERNRCIQLVNIDAEYVLETGNDLLHQLRPFVSRRHAGSITRA
jgi:hypothetical protein